ncbi:MAG: PIG-L family deacetylase [Chloroflexi bacterium]|nr:PIG-L family deacetylase [Chloroflexota bacterium]MCI0647753.1 PIG-L family deacetylase [Chloroflexota bacterium]MCI0728429.1 PIG-L family deacetylase [Chloroflexota bacterium]
MYYKPLKLMCVLAHPDDESLATGGILAKYAASGVQTHLIMATRGERGWFGPAADYPGPQALGRLRQAELRAAAQVLGLREVVFLDYHDGELDRADHAEAIAKIVTHLRRVQPDVVVTFDPNGMYGHPDHIAISQLTTTAVMAAADPSYPGLTTDSPHRVAKLYYRAFVQAEQVAYEATFGRLVMPVDSVERRFTAWPEWAITTWIDTSAYGEQILQAVQCHRSQLPDYQKLKALPAAYQARLWGRQSYYRALSLVNGGRQVEDDLFAGLRGRAQSQPLSYAARQPVAA